VRKKQILDKYIIGEVKTYRMDRYWQGSIFMEIEPVAAKLVKKNSSLSIKLSFYLHKSRISEVDIDNLCKSVLDALDLSGLYSDDSLVHNLEASKIPIDHDDPEGVRIQVWEWTIETPQASRTK
jgi:Holliday junction resolvase RusA-like endonuclease